jgi:transcription antitermination factor NusG
LRTPVKNPSWYVVATNPKCEEKAKAGLEDLGYATFLPTETVWARVPKHRQKPGEPKKVKVTRPLFPGYLFVGKEAVHSFEPARLTDGVYGFIMNGSEYLALPTKAINEMIEQQERGDHDKTIKAAERLAELIGKQITVPEGHLAGFVATVRKATEKCVYLEAEAFGKRVKLRMALETMQCL